MICWARYLLAALVLGLALVGGAPAQDRSALARLEPVRSAIVDEGRGIAVDLGLSQPVPWRVYLLDAPPRLVMDFREVDFSAARSEALEHSDRVVALRWGP
ncbi:N-acetylmuramoyl-L-alanine amidase, partial [Candidatus Falkowbacteria bacterium]|nr:N-acetylmuramoyl-L-alanine amidase [Candidatus Falkowbacteria bacterium]